MKRIVAFLAAGLMGAALTAQAQSPFNTGPYLGVHVGSSLGETTVLPVGAAGSGTFDLRPTGPAYGGLLGFNLKLGALGLGVEGEFNKMKAESTTNTFVGGSVTETSLSLDKGNRIRGRLGFATGDTFWFLAAGASKADSKLTVESLTSPGQRAESTFKLKGKNWGAGFEYAVGEGSLEKNFIVRVEYIADKYDAHVYDVGSVNPFFVNRQIDEISVHTLRAAFTYRFF